MVNHEATIHWRQQADENFLKGRYSREHTWEFDGGIRVPASPSPSVVPIPFSNPAAVDPEEAFVASIASCHMLTFLYIAGKKGYEVLSYTDKASGTMTKGENGVPWVSEVILNPDIEYHPERTPDSNTVSQLHEAAHHQCFIANSVKTNVSVAD